MNLTPRTACAARTARPRRPAAWALGTVVGVAVAVALARGVATALAGADFDAFSPT